MHTIAFLALLAVPAFAVDLKLQTVAAFDLHVRATEQRLADAKSFLWADESKDRLRRVKAGEIVVESATGTTVDAVPNGMMHDWVGSVFIPNVTLEQTLARVKDYAHHKDYYKPEVTESRVISHNGNDYLLYIRLLKKKVLTIVFNTEHAVRYTQVGEYKVSSVSRTTKVAEVDQPGKPGEREMAQGTGRGFLWKLNSYWRFEERDGGTYVECEAVSLTRDVPAGLGWLLDPVVRTLPKESLELALKNTRAAMGK
jgi:hypothetical protein